MYRITDLSEGYVRQCYAQWNNTISSDKPKGRLIWLYTDNNTPEEALENALACAKLVSGTPIVLMQLRDSEGLLQSALCDYLTLQSMTEADQQKYGRHYLDKIQQTENSIRQSFEQLKKARLHISENGVEPLPSRLASALTGIFENIYSKAVPFNFDGFASKQPGKARKAFCSIVRLILSDQISENTIHSFPADVRNRFDATLFANNSASWRVVNSDYQIIPPLNRAALAAYNSVVNLLPEGESIQLSKVIDILAAPPYGMNDYEAVYMIATIFANLSYCLRVEYKKQSYTISKWKDVVIGDSKIELAAIRETIVRRINAGAVADQFLALFNRINANTDTAMVDQLGKELDAMLRGEDIPEALSAQLQLARNKLQEGNRVLRNWNTTFDNAMSLYDKLLERQDFYSGLQCLRELKSYAFYRVFADTNYSMSEEQMQQLRATSDEIKAKIDPYLRGWIMQQKCKSVENMGGFRSFMKKLNELLTELSYTKEAALAQSVAEKELSNTEAIRERQELRRLYQTFISDCVVSDTTAYTRLLEWKKDAEKVAAGIEKNYDFLGSEAEGMKNTVANRQAKIENRIQEILGKMNAIYDALYSISSINDIQQIIADIKRLSLCGIPESDMEDFNGIDDALSGVLTDIETMMEEQHNRSRFQENYATLRKKYEETEMEFDVLSVLDGVAETVEKELDRRDKAWSEKHLSSLPDDLPDIHAWIQDTEILPNYLSDATKDAYAEMKKAVEDKLSKARINDVVFRFGNLSGDEKKNCFSILSEMLS